MCAKNEGIMCGICGKVNVNGVDREEVERMVTALSHRGPDEEGIFIGPSIGFGHRRLSIIDLASGQQPMSIQQGKLWITFNGEIYNFNEIKKELLEKKYQFQTTSDTEVLLKLYEDRAVECLQSLRGMFAFAIYDAREDFLFIARDHLGQKPLYYVYDDQMLAFASEIKALLALDPKLRELNLNALYEYFTVRFISPPKSMFKKIYKLPPGHYLTYHKGNLKIHRYWNLKFEPKTSLAFEEALDELDKLIRETVQYHLVSDVPVGAFLSGGMDSSLIVSMMSTICSEPLHTFTGDVPYQGYSELPFSRAVSQYCHTKHHEITIQPSLMRTLPQVIGYLDEPSDPLSLCMFSLAEFARRNVKVVLCGDGGDELFGGYDRYYGNVLVSYLALIPRFARKLLLEHLLKVIPESFWYRGLSHKLRWMLQMSFFEGSDRYAKSLGYFYFSDEHKMGLYTEKFKKEVGYFDPEAAIRETFDSDHAKDVIDRMLFSDTMLRMPDHPVMILDRMTMAHGLEARSPFLDHKLVEFCASLPSSYKIKGKRTRYIQSELAKKYVPSTVITRKKQGFASPLTYILDDEFRTLSNTILKHSHLVENGWLHSKYINQMMGEHLSRKVDHGNRLWLLFNAELWYRMFIENENIGVIQ